MKIYALKMKYELHQTTFYGWLRDQGLIVKEQTGYVVGPNGADMMETLTDYFLDSNGEIAKRTQVGVIQSQVQTLLAMYLDSGLPKLYAPSKKDDKKVQLESLAADLNRVDQRVVILEKQILILINQLATTEVHA
ncbi:hypothetical protein ACFQ4L_04495 [Lapidilactobacillus mulanensis]|uniref:Uncharacterized protein n=1 Tax=Lapidilactobacillus mulanensis TaxID=2485999 RepID=A0ABW4DPM8_9LACO|nr:hypothetical protein [Lapidilactobacillus mulanensis]